MSLFDCQLITIDPSTGKPDGWQKSGLTWKDKKGRAYRRRPYWIDVGKAVEGLTCKTCRWLTQVQFSKSYYKCGLWKITHGPGTQIATTDQACRFYGRRGLVMFTIKRMD